MILGNGIDLAEVDRIREAIERHGRRFIDRIYTPAEIAYVERKANKYERYAARFAAKEAGMKALGTGRSQGVLWKDVSVRRLGGPPQLVLTGGAARRFAAMNGRNTLLTVTHARDLAIAQVMLFGPGDVPA